MFVLEYLAIGFITVFGWNSGQAVWDKYVDIPQAEQSQKSTGSKNDTRSKI